MLVVTRNDKALRAPIRKFLATEDAPDGFYLNIHDKAGPYMVGRETMRLAGRSHVRETIAGASFLVSPTAFFQTNVDAADALVQLVLDAVGDRHGLNVLDLYAGSGLFTIPLAASRPSRHADRREPPGRARRRRQHPSEPDPARPDPAARGARRGCAGGGARDPVDLVVLDPAAPGLST